MLCGASAVACVIGGAGANQVMPSGLRRALHVRKFQAFANVRHDKTCEML